MKPVRFVCLFVILTSAMLAAQSNPVPLISQPLVPASVTPGSGGFTLTVNGAGFGSNAAVYWNGSIRPTSVLSGSTVQAQISAADVANKGTGWVTAANPGTAFSNVVYFPIRDSAQGLGFLKEKLTISHVGPAVVGDFNNDGKLDAAVGNGTTIEIFRGRGTGSFKSPIVTTSKINVVSMVAGDFNGDGKLDLVVENTIQTFKNYNIAVFLGKGDGTFTQKKSFAGPPRSSILGVADFNGDGNLDLYVGGNDQDGPFFRILFGNGDGTFKGGGGGSFDCGDGGQPAIADFNGDGLLDVAAIDGCAGAVFVFLNGFQEVSYPLNTFGGSNIAAADVNGDGKVDLVTDGVSVLLGNGDGTFGDGGGVMSDGGGSVNVGDFNGDGKLDIAAGLSMLLGNGDGTFQSPLTFAGLSSYQAVSMGDLNGDGKLDLIGTPLSVFRQVRVYLTPTHLDFGTQGIGKTSQPQTASLTNFGTITPLTVSKINITGVNAADYAQTNNCGSSIPPNGSCQIQVTFTPSLEGTENAELDVTYPRSDTSDTLRMPLTGTGKKLVTTVALTPPSLTYPVQLVGTTSSPQTSTLTNTGNQPVIISSISATAPFGETNNCPSSLSVGTACQIQVVFTPTGPGKVNGTLSVTDNADGSPQTVALSGVGTIVKLSPGTINFGNQKVGTTSVPIPITLTNVGTTSLSITQIAIKGTNPGDFAQTNDCGNSVQPHGQCTITVTFTPTITGHRSARVSLSDNGGGSPQQAVLIGTGT